MKFSWSRANSLWVLVAVLLLSFSMGCRTKSQDETTSNGDGPSDGQHTEEPLEPLEGEPTVDFWDWDQTQKAVHQNNGQVVVLYAWGLWNETLDSPDLADKIE
ncbi:MAG: hypothetical protein KDA84_06365, partial [Planctomycetaceae bacterium]|nr:hypothetical protein [Planctomycetaceae bacterium]